MYKHNSNTIAYFLSLYCVQWLDFEKTRPQRKTNARLGRIRKKKKKFSHKSCQNLTAQFIRKTFIIFIGKLFIRMTLKTPSRPRFLRELCKRKAYKYIAKETRGKQVLRRHIRIDPLFCNTKWRLHPFYTYYNILYPSVNVFLSKSNEYFPLQPNSLSHSVEWRFHRKRQGVSRTDSILLFYFNASLRCLLLPIPVLFFIFTENKIVLQTLSSHLLQWKWIMLYSDSQRAESSGDRMLMKARFSGPAQTGLALRPASCGMSFLRSLCQG